MIKEAKLVKTENGRTPESDGWFVLHASEAPWVKSQRFGLVCNFEGDTSFAQIGINIHVVQPGQAACLYHSEDAQEGFFILSGECVLLIEEQERRLRAGHFVHCPPWTTHVFVGAGDGPCAILMIGHRAAKEKLRYPVSALAAGHGASAKKETASPREAYGGLPVFDETAKPCWPLY